MSQTEVRELIHRLHKAQQQVTHEMLDHADFQKLGYETPDGFTVRDVLRMWVWHYWSHHRDLVLAHGRLTGDNPHVHVPHYVRQANEEFGRYIGELACLSDDQLDLRVPGGGSAPESGRTVREVVEHTLATLEDYLAEQVRNARPTGKTTGDGRQTTDDS